MATVWKAIKPKRLKQDAMRLALLNGMRKVGRQIKKDFEKTTRTWEHKPEFEMLISLAGVGPTVLVSTDDEIYGYVSRGTRPHIIRPKQASALRFQGVYTAKTLPGVIDSRGGGGSGDVVFAQEVQHPGTKARKFEETIEKKWRKPFRRQMEEIMRDVARASGHGR